MKHYGLIIAEGTQITNPTIAHGTAFPSNESTGELFFRTDLGLLYIYDGSQWATVSVGLNEVVDDETPQLGGNLDINAHQIVSTSDGDIILNPDGTGNVILGRFEFDVDQSLGSPQDSYVLTYSHSTQTIQLEPNIAQAEVGFTVDSFEGDGSTSVFTLSVSSTTNACFVCINGTMQTPTTAYTVAGTTLTLAEAPDDDADISVRILTTS